MKIIYVSQFDDNCGYGSAARGYLESLDSVITEKNEIRVYSISLETELAKLSVEEKRIVDKYRLKNLKEIKDFILDEKYIVIWHMPPPMLETFYKVCDKSLENIYSNFCYIVDNSYKNINISAWEADKIPYLWNEIYKKIKVNGIIVPSEWNLNTYKKEQKNVKCVPHLIRTSTEKKNEIVLPIDVQNKFCIFSMSQWDIRKGFDILIKAYLMEFKNQQDVVLLLKTYGTITNSFIHSQEEQKNNIISEISSFKKSIFLEDNNTPSAKIIPIFGAIEYEKINYLYDISSCFALATRGEGFGLTIAEAVLKNKPVIVPKEGGHLDYLKNYRKVKYVNGHWSPYYRKPGYSCDMNWYEPDINSLRMAMRQEYEEWKAGISCDNYDKSFLTKEEIGNMLLKEIGLFIGEKEV